MDILQADARRLKQIIVNLLSNAVKFTPEGGTVGLETKGYPEREAVAISVWDTGIGIAEQDLGRLFQPFVQLDSSLSRQYAGTGLGLSLVRSLTNLHGGSVTVESRVSQGSRFTVLLPWKAEKMDLEQRADDNARGKGLSASQTIPSLSVLAVDDNPAAIAGTADLLRFRGYRVQVVSSGSEAIKYLASNKPDVILMDIQMPIMDGLETTRRIRELGCQVPVIAVTALAMAGGSGAMFGGWGKRICQQADQRKRIDPADRITGHSMRRKSKLTATQYPRAPRSPAARAAPAPRPRVPDPPAPSRAGLPQTA